MEAFTFGAGAIQAGISTFNWVMVLAFLGAGIFLTLKFGETLYIGYKDQRESNLRIQALKYAQPMVSVLPK
jgi:hypothetical protein